jgi:hypothetical protein
LNHTRRGRLIAHVGKSLRGEITTKSPKNARDQSERLRAHGKINGAPRALIEFVSPGHRKTLCRTNRESERGLFFLSSRCVKPTGPTLQHALIALGAIKECEKCSTFDVQQQGHVDFGLGVDLTLVDAGVTLLHKVYAKIPLVRALGVNHREAGVSCVRVDAGRQNVQVSLPHPRHLESEIFRGQNLKHTEFL